MLKRVHIFAACAVALASAAQAQTTLLDRAVARYRDTNTLRASFRQTLSNPLTGSTTTSTGILLRRSPNLLSVTFQGAQGDRVVADGTALWIYSPTSAPGQVIKMPMNGRVNTIDPGGEFLVNPRARYNVTAAGTAAIGGNETQIFELVPRQQNPAFTRARVWIDASDATVRQFETTDASGLRRVVEILSWRPDVTIPRSAFRFTPPAGARVIDQSALTGQRK